MSKPSISYIDELLQDIDVQIHETPLSILRAYWGEDDDLYSDDEFLDLEVEGSYLSRDTIWEGTMQGCLDDIQSEGVWGFADIPSNTVHLWDGGEVSRSELILVIAHELAHFLPPLFVDAELRSWQVSLVSQHAYDWLLVLRDEEY